MTEPPEAGCPPLQRAMLPRPLDLNVPPGLSRPEVMARATLKARTLHPEVMLLAWFDRLAGEFSPAIACCREDLPGWLAYALSRGADLIISVNHEEYVFAFKKL